MTAKSCLNCSQLGSYNIGKTGRRCYGISAIPEQFPIVIKLSALAGFYCGSWVQKEVQPKASQFTGAPGAEIHYDSPIGEPNATRPHCEECGILLNIPQEHQKGCPRGEAVNTVPISAGVIKEMSKEELACVVEKIRGEQAANTVQPVDLVDRVIAVMEERKDPELCSECGHHRDYCQCGVNTPTSH